MFEPSYLKLYESGELDERIARLYSILESCELCPRRCKVNRLKAQKGYCRSGVELTISSYGPHFGEEPEITGRNGSGTIFLTNCNLLCIFCQNYETSHLGYGKEVSIDETAEIMLRLQGRGCHNINVVTPTHYTPQLVKTISVAAARGLKLPIFWNCSGYENVETIKLLEGIVDIYKPDIKYGESEPAKKYSNAPDYFERCKEAVREMHRQVGDLKVNKKGIAYRGLLIRHLVLPNNLAGSEKVLEFAAELSKESYVNIMAQYRPCGKAYEHEKLSRRPSRTEYFRVVDYAKKLGLHRGFRAH
ncbi:MAG: radical SAM protein [Candidatus Bathyarchaeia archaeon]|jgi:putative pyruvate formate lyase activating enzyme